MRSQLASASMTLLALSMVGSDSAFGQQSTEEDSSRQSRQLGALIDFASDVWPILQTKCLSCHGPDDAKNDFRVDDSEIFLGYVEPNDVDSSSVWSDYLVTDDDEMRMPPVASEADATPLTGAELATLKLWIEEGANWSELPAAEGGESQPVEIEKPPPKSTAAKVWSFQGLFHPATVHFPVALLTVSTAFVLLSFLSRASFEPVAFHCLWIGALGAIVSSLAGWSYAQHEGYGAGFSFNLLNSSIDRHRWLGIAVAVIAVALIPVARSAARTDKAGTRLLWLLGSLIMLGAVATTGYQGGQLTYGEDHYTKEYQRLFGTTKPAEIETPATEDAATDDGAAAADQPVDEGQSPGGTSTSDPAEGTAAPTDSDAATTGAPATSETPIESDATTRGETSSDPPPDSNPSK